MTTGNEGIIYEEFFNLILKYSSEKEFEMDRLVLDLIALRPANIPISQAWNLFRDITKCYLKEAKYEFEMNLELFKKLPYQLQILEPYLPKAEYKDAKNLITEIKTIFSSAPFGIWHEEVSILDSLEKKMTSLNEGEFCEYAIINCSNCVKQY